VAPVLVEKPWGGTKLSEIGKYPGRAYFGESWEIADLPPEVASSVEDPVTRVIDGRWRGWSLGGLAAKVGEDLMGPVSLTESGRFPLLIKFLDAREHLSVQVHPTAAYTKIHPGTHLKTESWYVVDADPGSSLFLDFDPATSDATVQAALDGVSVIPHLRQLNAQPGAFHHVPAGMIHALGAGVMVAEVQTPSDTTFRIYDWSGEYDREPRKLHTTEARETVIPSHPKAFNRPPIGDTTQRELIRTDHYWIDEHATSGDVALSRLPGVRVLMCVEGMGQIGDVPMEMGSTVVVPASSVDYPVHIDGKLLEIGIPTH
jgi:mannose-6-phosphate isomerase